MQEWVEFGEETQSKSSRTEDASFEKAGISAPGKGSAESLKSIGHPANAPSRSHPTLGGCWQSPTGSVPFLLLGCTNFTAALTETESVWSGGGTRG